MPGRAVAAAVLGAAVALGGLATSAGLGLLMDSTLDQVGAFGLFSSMVFLPVALALIALSAILTPSHYARMWIALGALAVALVGTATMGIGFGAASNGVVEGIVAGVLFWGMPLALSAMGLVYNAAIGIPARRTADHVARLERLENELAQRGHWSFDDAAAAVGVEDAVALAAEARRTGRAPLELDLHHGRMWSVPWAEGRCADLALALEREGRVEVAAFAAARGVPVEMVREWVYTLVYRRQITGYVSWREGVLYAADAAALRGSSRCPACDGQLELVARGVIACQHCDTQTLLT